MTKHNYKVIAFDADDTLWVNETFFRESEYQLARMLAEFGEEEYITQELFHTEMNNIKYYGYGIKGFTISMLETAIRVSKNTLSAQQTQQIIDLSKAMIEKPVELLDQVEEVLQTLQQRGYKMVVATKGDLLDQQRKLRKSKLESYFHHIEVMSDKQESDYQQLIQHLDIKAEDFLMIGNSVKSDILPVLNLGGSAIHIPFHTTWVHERMGEIEHEKLRTYSSIKEIVKILK